MRPNHYTYEELVCMKDNGLDLCQTQTNLILTQKLIIQTVQKQNQQNKNVCDGLAQLQADYDQAIIDRETIRRASAKQKLQDLGLTVDEIKEAFGEIMALSKIQAESMNLADTYAFTGTVTGTPSDMVSSIDASGTQSDTIVQAFNGVYVTPSQTILLK